MISICIPVYNFDVTGLVAELLNQCLSLKEKCEIILIDDGSDEYYKKANCKKADLLTYVQLEQNIGRSAIRNKFLEYAKYEYLLFLDCDSIVLNVFFLQTYVKTIKNFSHQLICGGRIYKNEKPKKNKRLRWKYGIEKESKNFQIRNINPNQSFMTNNFVVHKDILSDVKFDEQLTKYGHEDTLFGYELERKGIKILHIKNTIVNGFLENNDVYLMNTEYAIQNLVQILKIKKYAPSFIKHVTLLDYYYNNKVLIIMIKALFTPLKRIIKILLINGYVNIKLFDLYKILVLEQTLQKKE